MVRYIVERISDGKFLDLEFPLEVESASTSLAGPGRLAGTVAPDIGGLKLPDGSLVVEPGGTYISEEADGEIRATWLVTFSGISGSEWKVEGDGFSAFLDKRPFEGEYRGVQVDPVVVGRHVVEHAQSFAGANAGITVTGSSNVRVGTNSDEKEAVAQAAADAAKKDADNAKKALDAARDAAKKNNSQANKNLVEQRKKASEAANERKKKRDDELRAAKERVSEDGGAWKILWWDTPDCLTEFNDAVSAAGMEWVEWSGWNADRTKILKEIRVLPRVGAKRTNVVFVQGENLIGDPAVTDATKDYANTVLAIGAGEGRAALRVTVGEADSRLRQVYVLEAKDVSRLDVLQTRAREELKRRMTKYRVDAIRVQDHPNARIGSFGVGDTIMIDADFEWIGRKKLWRRISEIERVSDDVVDVFLEDA